MPRRTMLWSTLLLLSTAIATIPRSAHSVDAGPAADLVATAPGGQPVVTAIGVVKGASGTQITISGDTDLTYEYFLIEGRSLAIDIPGAGSTVWPAEQQLEDEFVSGIQVAARQGDKPGTRVVLALKNADGFTVRGENGRIVVRFARVGAAAPAARAALNRVAEVRAYRLANSFRVAVKTDAKPSYRVLESPDPTRVTLAVDGAGLEPAARKTSDYSALDTPVTRVSAWSEAKDPSVVLVAIDLRRPLPFRAFTDGNGINVDFALAALDPPPAAAPGPGSSLAPAPVSTLADPAPPAPAADDPEPLPAPRQFTGRRITLDFIDADIADIFRLIADVSGMNIVATDDVKGRRSVKMTEVPWDQALELILKTNLPQLVQIRESDTIIRVTTLQRVLDEQAALEKRRLEQVQRALAEQKQGLEKAEFARKLEAENQRQQLEKFKAERQRSKGWRERTFLVSYGDTAEVAKRLEKFYSGCKDGCVFEAGTHSKSIFVRDFVDNVEQMNAVFAALESPTSAVMVEARIVEVQSDYSEAIGIQWGATAKADAAHGNATKFAFPNSVGITGNAAGSDTYLVNLPVTGAVGGVGVSLGHIANTLSLDVRLSALEKMGKTKILSSPKVLVIQNEEANINVGSQLPVPSTDAEGNRTVTWRDVGILLKVTPTVTSDGRVFLKIKIEKSAAGETVKTTEGEMFSIERRGAETKVLVADGETSVIGGIFQQTENSTQDGLPGLSRLPIIGWLFKSKSSGNKRTELMIFLTPRIVDAVTDPGTSLRDGAADPATATTAGRAFDDPGRGVFGSVDVLHAELAAGGRSIDASVNYRNDTALTFASSVTVNCRALGRDGRVIGAENAHLFARDRGPITPGFQGELRLSFSLEDSGFTELRCGALEAE